MYLKRCRLLVRCYQALDQQAELVAYLQQSFERAPTATTLLALAEQLQLERGDYQAASYITEQLKRRPSIKGFNRLIDLQLSSVPTEARDSLLVLRGLTGQLQQSKPSYRCHSCGFSGRELHWLCPGCQSWGAIAPIQGLEGE